MVNGRSADIRDAVANVEAALTLREPPAPATVERQLAWLAGTENRWTAERGEVRPLNDLRDHLFGATCWCRPHYDGTILVHHAADQREEYEHGRRKPS